MRVICSIVGFSALQRAENSSIQQRQRLAARVARFSALQRAENSSIANRTRRTTTVRVSVLFSEPKIPQVDSGGSALLATYSFSALQRAENSSNALRVALAGARGGGFQCSSASRKFLNSPARHARQGRAIVSVLFSEPKIPQAIGAATAYLADKEFQCSSASRKFLNLAIYCTQLSRTIVSVLFSEPKIPQQSLSVPAAPQPAVSVLFSEPKIPQVEHCDIATGDKPVSVLFSEPKIPQSSLFNPADPRPAVSVLFSEPKIPQVGAARHQSASVEFQCSSASRKFLNSPICVTTPERA